MGQQHVDNAIVNNAIRIFNLAKDEWTTYYVDKDGVHGQAGNDDKFNGLSWQTPFATIQHALDTGEAGAKIYIADGTYTEELNIESHHVKLIGDTREGTIIAPTTCTDYVVHVTGDQCVIERLKIVFPTASGGTAALYLESFKNVINNVWLHNTGNDAWGVLTVAGSDEQIVQNCKITGFANQCNIDGGDYHKLHDNIMILNGAGGINVYITSTNRCEVYENLLDGAGAGYGLDSDTNVENVYYHNNILNHTDNTDETDANNCWVQNYYDDATTDLDHNGIGDSPYAVGDSTEDYDYEPIVRYNGWKHLSPGTSAIGTMFDRAYYAAVTTYTDTTHFAATALAGFGDTFFKGWYVSVLYDAVGAGAAPQTESQPISAYTSSTGTFTHTAFTAPLAAGDKVLVIHSSTSPALIADAVWDEATSGHLTAGTFGASLAGASGNKLGGYTGGADSSDSTHTSRGHLLLLQEETEWTEIDDYSDYSDTTTACIKANQEYPVLEVVQSGGTITAYKYVWTVAEAGANPTETRARTTITGIDGDMFELTKIVLSLKAGASGIWSRMGAADKAYIYGKFYSNTNAAFELLQPVVLRDKAVDTLITSPPVDTDLGEVIVIDPTLMPTSYRFIIYLYNNANILLPVYIPFYFGVRRTI